MANMNHSVGFFDRQFREQLRKQDPALNPFERVALAHCRGRVLDFGCGLGNLAVSAARAGLTLKPSSGKAATTPWCRSAC